MDNRKRNIQRGEQNENFNCLNKIAQLVATKHKWTSFFKKHAQQTTLVVIATSFQVLIYQGLQMYHALGVKFL